MPGRNPSSRRCRGTESTGFWVYAVAIHPTAIVHPGAKLDPGVEVGPYAVIDEHVTVGAGSVIGPHAHLTGQTTLGRDNRIHTGAVLGDLPQDTGFAADTVSYLRIGDRNIFREHATAHRGTQPETITTIGNDCFVMATAHIGHNCMVADHVILANGSALAGYVEVQERVFISANAVIHQFCRVGRLAMLSGISGISLDLPPFLIATERNQVHAINLVGLKRAGIVGQTLREIKRLYRLFYRSGLSTSNALADATVDDALTTPEAQEFLSFVRSSTRGILPGKRSR